MTAYYSKELAEHHRTIINHAEADLRAAQTMLEVNDYQLRQANKHIAEMREQLLQANAWLVLLPIMAFAAGVVLAVLVIK